MPERLPDSWTLTTDLHRIQTPQSPGVAQRKKHVGETLRFLRRPPGDSRNQAANETEQKRRGGRGGGVGGGSSSNSNIYKTDPPVLSAALEAGLGVSDDEHSIALLLAASVPVAAVCLVQTAYG